ncbi:hypothetical protein FACS189413_18120 [Bacteroidia bacterium]|nr:hypothetical protein FACS189413_18120 [Bacteroidia bacterium]
MYIEMNSRDDNSWNDINSANGCVMTNWKPGSSRWFDCISFYFVEDDDNCFAEWMELTLTALKYGKIIAGGQLTVKFGDSE